MYSWNQTVAAVFASVILVGCVPQQRQVSCPTALISCPCAELEYEATDDDIGALVTMLRDFSDTRLQDTARAATEVEARCRDEEGPLPPPVSGRDAGWRERCSGAETALPALLGVLEEIESRRAGDRPSSPEENSLAARAVTALGNVIIGNPESSCRGDVVRALVDVLRVGEPAQDLSVNDRAVLMLGAIGDDAAAEALVLALFMRSERRSLALLEPARVALMQLEDHEGVARELVRAGHIEGASLERLLEADERLDVLFVKEQVADTLATMGDASPAVVGYLESELRHVAVDEADRSASARRGSLTPEQCAAWRRVYAARALARIRHEPALDVILGRLSLDTQAGRLVDPSVDILEVPGYLEALGAYQLPERTDTVLLDWVGYGRDINLDRAARWLSLQGGVEHADRLTAAVSALPPCPANTTRCIRRNIEQQYLPVLRSAAGCASLECWVDRLASPGVTNHVRERAAYQVAMLSRDPGATRDEARSALVTALLGGGADAPLEAYAFAIDRLSPEGCDEECMGRLQEHLDAHHGDISSTGDVRRVAGLLGRLRSRVRRRGR